MPVKIVSREYSNNFRPETTDWLLGNVGDYITLNLKVDVEVVFFASAQNPIQIDYLNNSLILVNGDSWGKYGFDTGSSINFRLKRSVDTNGDGEYDDVQNFISNHAVVNTYDNVLVLGAPIPDDRNYGEMVPNNFGTRIISEVFVASTRAPEGMDIIYGHITNEGVNSANLSSFIDGTSTRLVKPQIPNNGSNFELMEAVGMKSGMSIVNARAKSIGQTFDLYHTFKYEIELTFIISSFFEDLSNLQELEIPSYLEGNGSLTDNFLISFYPEWNNPNVKISNDTSETKRLGNTGWFNENFNELNNDFELISLQYFDSMGSLVDSLDYSAETKVVAKIRSVQDFTEDSRFSIGFGWIPNDPEDYKNNQNTFADNTYLNIVGKNFSIHEGEFILANLQGYGIDGASMSIRAIRFTANGNEVTMECFFNPNPQFFNKFDEKDEDDRNYFIFAGLDDREVSSNFSERVSLLLDVNTLQKTIPLAGAYDSISTDFVSHPQGNDDAGIGFYSGLIQDDILARSLFQVKKDGSIRLNKIGFGFEAYNPSTQEKETLENKEVDLSQFPYINNVGEYNYSESRGFKFNEGNNKDIIKIERLPGNDTPETASYVAYFGTKLRWEDWIQKENVNDVFYNPDEEHNGFHNDWINYHRTNGFKVYYVVSIQAIVDGQLTLYKNRYDIEFVDYDENLLIESDTKYYKHNDDTLLNVGVDENGNPIGVILNNELTRIEISHRRLDGQSWSLDSVYAVNTIEIDRGSGSIDERQLSSVWTRENDNPLKPIEGETSLKLEINGNGDTITAICLVDPELLEDAPNYRITGRISGCNRTQGGGGEEPKGLYEERYEEVYE